jgi:hypothetical protein
MYAFIRRHLDPVDRLVPNPNLAVRVSNVVALSLLFLLGARWGRMVGGSSLRIATGLTQIGGVLVVITIALGR